MFWFLDRYVALSPIIYCIAYCQISAQLASKLQKPQNFNFFSGSNRVTTKAGATFDNSFFDNSFVFLRQFKNRSFLGEVFLVEVRINRTKTGQHLILINSNFDFLMYCKNA